MPQFYWQLQTNTEQQQRENDSKIYNEWSYVHLNNDNTHDGIQQEQQQQQQQQQQPYWCYQQSETGIDPYSAAVFQGFRASSNDVDGSKSWPTLIASSNSDTFLSQQEPKRIPEDEGVIDGKYKEQHVKEEVVFKNDVGGNVATNALLTEEGQVTSETESGLSTLALTQSSTITSKFSATEIAPFSAAYQTLPEAAPSPNIAFVVPVSNRDSSGFNNRIIPTLQPVIPDPQIPPLASFANIDCTVPPLSVEETGRIQNTASVEGKQTDSNFLSEVNSQQTGAAVVLDKEKESVRKTVDEDASSLPTDSFQETQEQNELKQILKIDKESSTELSTPAERSTDSTAPDDSLIKPTEKHRDPKNVRDRYRIIRQQYPEVIKRLDRLRKESHHLDWRSLQKTPLLEIDENSHRISIKRERNSMVVPDFNITMNPKDVEPVSDSRPSSRMNHSYTVPDRMSSEDSSTKNDVYYGEDFVNSLRRNRHARTRERDYFLSRGTKSEMGEIGPYKGPALAKYKYMMQSKCGVYPSVGYQPHEYYPSGRQSLGPHHGRRVAHELATMYNGGNITTHRPRSSLDEPYSKYQQLNEFAQDLHKNDGKEHSFESEEDSSGSDSEVARIHNEQEMARQTTGTCYNSMPFTAPNEFYYFGVIQLPQERVEYIMRKLPPPPEYYQLPAMEKAAYLFYCVLYRHHFLPVDLFHKKFNREYFSYMCEGDSSEVALWKICKHTQEEYITKRSRNQLKAYELSQKQLFSDEHETIDSRQSERGSRYDAEDSDQLSIDSAAKEPLKFRVPHSFLTFGVGGKVVMLNVQNSENILEMRDLKSLFRNPKLLHISNAIESFRGPLIAGFTPTHSVLLYVQRQIELILTSEAYLSNPSDSLESDCLLIWQLLEMLVQQQGRVTGPDLSRLLMTTRDVLPQGRHGKEKSKLHTPEIVSEKSVDSGAYDRFTQLLLGGHIKEALENAIKDGLYTDAMILARRICVNEPQELEKVEMAFLSHRSELNPVLTLFAVANGQPAPVLTSPPMDGTNSWRSHAAMVLANLNTPAALGTVYQLGCVLSRRKLHAAADFCFLAVSLLMPSYDPFQPVPVSEDINADVRRHITLIHATLRGEDMNFGFSKGFSIIDLHATEIFHYSIKLANSIFPGNFNSSLAYQLYRLDYAEMISEFGNSAADAFRYCVEIARETWDRRHEIDIEYLERLHELAERLKFAACSDANDTAWIATLRSFIDKQRIVFEESGVVEKNTMANAEHDIESVGPVMVPKISPQIKAEENSTENNDIQVNDFASTKVSGSERVEWHIGQEAISTSIIPTEQQEIENRKPENNEYRLQPGQLRERVATYSNMNASINSQLLGLSPVLPPSMKDSAESTITTHTTVVSPSLSQANEQISHEAVQNYYNDVTCELKGTDSMMMAEYVTDGNSTSTNSHENTPQTNFDHLEGKVLSGMATVGAGSQIQETVRSGNMPPTSQNSEHSFPSQKQSNTIMKNEKTHNDGKIISDHHQNPGLFSKLKATIAKAIPSGNEMILPDDKHPSIVWDPKLNRYVGEGIEEEFVKEFPPSFAPSSEKLNGSVHGKVGGLIAARLSGGSRYFNPLIETSSSMSVAPTASLLPSVPAAAAFGFIPSMPDDNEASTESPFSVHTDPLRKETETSE